MKSKIPFLALLVLLNLGMGIGHYNLRHEILVPALFCAVEPAVEGNFRIYYNFGPGFNESDTTNVSLSRRVAHRPIRVKLPEKHIYSLRIDPVDQPVNVDVIGLGFGLFDNFMLHPVESPHIVGTANLSAWKVEGNKLHLEVTPGSNDPYFVLADLDGLISSAQQDVALVDRGYRIAWAVVNVVFAALFFLWRRK